MHCPHCGQQQINEVVRFCSRCGFPLEGTIHLLANGGLLPMYQPPAGIGEASPRKKGVRQGAMLLLLGVLVVPLLAILGSFAPGGLGDAFDMFTALAAVICFVGGVLRMLYAALFEEGARPVPRMAASPYFSPSMTPRLNVPVGSSALPPAFSSPASSWNQGQVNTGELSPRPSVTENTTRLLDDKTKSETG